MYFEQNLKLISERWPQLAERLHKTSDPEQVELVIDAPEITLLINGIHLSSCYDRLREARIQAELVPEGSTLAHVYGLATGDLPRLLLSRSELKELNVLVMSLAVARASLAYLDHSDWLTNPRVNLLMASSESDLQFPFACASATLSLADDGGARIRDLLYLELATPYISLQHQSLEEELRERMRQNSDYVDRDQSVSVLFSSLQGKDIYIAAAGPTLSESFHLLAAQREKIFLIAVDASVAPLTRAGFIPDLVISIDAAPHLFDLFFAEIDPVKYSEVSLVYFPIAEKMLLERWPGQRFLAYSQNKLYDDLVKIHPQGCLFASGSVLHSAIDLAVKMGASRIYLAGADFSFPKGQSHAEGCAAHLDVKDARLASYWVLNGRGERVPSCQNFRGYLRDLERYLALHPDLEFINCSLEGAKIEGTLSLESGG